MPTAHRRLVRLLDHDCLPKTFQDLQQGDTFSTNSAKEGGILGIGMTCLKLADGQSEKGNAVLLWGQHAGEVTNLEATDEVELEQSALNLAFNSILHRLRKEKDKVFRVSPDRWDRRLYLLRNKRRV